MKILLSIFIIVLISCSPIKYQPVIEDKNHVVILHEVYSSWSNNYVSSEFLKHLSAHYSEKNKTVYLDVSKLKSDSLYGIKENVIRLTQKFYKRRYLGPQDGSCSSYDSGCSVWDELTVIETKKNGKEKRYLYEFNLIEEDADRIANAHKNETHTKKSYPKLLCYKYNGIESIPDSIYNKIKEDIDLEHYYKSTWKNSCASNFVEENFLSGYLISDTSNWHITIVNSETREILYSKIWIK